MSDFKKVPKRFNATNQMNAKSRTNKNTNCTQCSKQRTMFKKKCVKQDRNQMQQHINGIDVAYKNDAFASKYQSLQVMNESDEEFRKRFFKGSRHASMGRNVFDDKIET